MSDPLERIARLRRWDYGPTAQQRLDSSGVLNVQRREHPWDDIAWLIDVAEVAIAFRDATQPHVQTTPLWPLWVALDAAVERDLRFNRSEHTRENENSHDHE